MKHLNVTISCEMAFSNDQAFKDFTFLAQSIQMMSSNGEADLKGPVSEIVKLLLAAYAGTEKPDAVVTEITEVQTRG